MPSNLKMEEFEAQLAELRRREEELRRLDSELSARAPVLRDDHLKHVIALASPVRKAVTPTAPTSSDRIFSFPIRSTIPDDDDDEQPFSAVPVPVSQRRPQSAARRAAPAPVHELPPQLQPRTQSSTPRATTATAARRPSLSARPARPSAPQPATPSAVSHEDDSAGLDEGHMAGLSAAATIRLQRAKLQSLEQQLVQLRDERNDLVSLHFSHIAIITLILYGKIRSKRVHQSNLCSNSAMRTSDGCSENVRH